MPHYFSTRLEFYKLSYLDDRRTQDPQKLSSFSRHGKPNLEKKTSLFAVELIWQANFTTT